jgi:hypothetical protein
MRVLLFGAQAVNALKDLLILLDSDVFFGMMDSNYSCVARHRLSREQDARFSLSCRRRLLAELGVALRRFKSVPVAITKTDWIIVP